MIRGIVMEELLFLFFIEWGFGEGKIFDVM